MPAGCPGGALSVRPYVRRHRRRVRLPTRRTGAARLRAARTRSHCRSHLRSLPSPRSNAPRHRPRHLECAQDSPPSRRWLVLVELRVGVEPLHQPTLQADLPLHPVVREGAQVGQGRRHASSGPRLRRRRKPPRRCATPIARPVRSGTFTASHPRPLSRCHPDYELNSIRFSRRSPPELAGGRSPPEPAKGRSPAEPPEPTVACGAWPSSRRPRAGGG